MPRKYDKHGKTTGPKDASHSEYMRDYRKENPAYETGGPKRPVDLDRSKPTGSPKTNPDYHKQYMRWKRNKPK
jgi:hypothetical protein